MRKALFIIVLLLMNCTMFAQMVFHDPVSARIFNTQKYSDINGSPFLYDKWIKGIVVTNKGVYKDIELKLDIYDHTLYFNKDETAYEFADVVQSFVLILNPSDSSSYQHYTKGVSSGDPRFNPYLRVLVEGKYSLYKQYGKSLSELNEINKGVVKTFTSVTKYFVKEQDTLKPLRFAKNELLELMKDRKADVEKFMAEQKLSGRSEKDVVQIFEFYNSL